MKRFFVLASLMVIALAGCDSNDGGNGGDNNNPPSGMVRISGTVSNTQSQTLSGAAIHVLYEGSGLTIFDPDSRETSIDDTLPPVELASFSAVGGNNAVSLYWTTVSENNADYFILSRDGAEIVHIPSQGNSPSGASYQFVDAAVINGTVYFYTLVVVDFSGARWELASAYATPSIGVVTEYALHQNFPNPFRGVTYITFDLAEANMVDLQIFNVAGQVEMTVIHNTPMTAGRHRVTIASDSLSNGLHEYRLRIGDGVFEASKLMLRGETSPPALTQMKPMKVTTSGGRYSIDIPASVDVEVRDEQNRDLGSTVLSRVSVISLDDDYAPAFQTINISAGQSWTVDLVHSPTETLPPGLIVQVGDTTIIIPDSAQAFADANFSRDAYMLREYQVATVWAELLYGWPYEGTFAEWTALPWPDRTEYLSVPYNSDLLGAWQSSPVEYYEGLSSRVSQFGYGWRDTYAAGVDPLTVPPDSNIWADPSDPLVAPDAPQTVAFDGTSNLLNRYCSMWIRIVN